MDNDNQKEKEKENEKEKEKENKEKLDSNEDLIVTTLATLMGLCENESFKFD